MVIVQSSPEAITHAAEIIRSGGLVAFPTETVYGLGANALDANAVKKIYEAKGRPAHNPIIVHVASIDQAKALTTYWPKSADMLTQKFWPGPLTIVLPKSSCVPDIITASGPTIAIRMPSHPIAHALIEAAGTPIAAPSANISGSISSVTATHVEKDLGQKIPLIIDGGHTPGGIESTVIDLSSETPLLLRPGLLSISEIETIIGKVERQFKTNYQLPITNHPMPSPGMLDRHYAPSTPLVIGSAKKAKELIAEGKRIGFLTFLNKKFDLNNALIKAIPKDPNGYAEHLYDALHELDSAGLDCIVVDPVPETDAWLGIRDRLVRASYPESNHS